MQKLVRSFLARRRVEKVKAKKSAMGAVVGQYMYAVRMQKLVRSFLARRRAKHALFEAEAKAKGLLVACEGTKQGETGWYRANDQMFYFCVDESEFVMLCGPVSKELYAVAVEEIDQIIARSALIEDSTGKGSLAKLKFPHLKLSKNISIDRLGLHTTRVQIETLLDDLRVRDEYITKVEDELNALKTTHTEVVDKLNKQLEEYSTTTSLLQKENEGLQYKTRFIKDELQDKLQLAAKLDDKMFVKLTSLARGYLGRKKVDRLKLFKIADETGILVAMSNTVQGESGWYIGPQGSIFYFVLKEVSLHCSLHYNG